MLKKTSLSNGKEERYRDRWEEGRREREEGVQEKHFRTSDMTFIISISEEPHL